MMTMPMELLDVFQPDVYLKRLPEGLIGFIDLVCIGIGLLPYGT